MTLALTPTMGGHLGPVVHFDPRVFPSKTHFFLSSSLPLPSSPCEALEPVPALISGVHWEWTHRFPPLLSTLLSTGLCHMT